jgi:hypothetical protein
MLAFEISINGKRLCIAGTGMASVVSTGVSWTRREPDTIRFNVGGIVAANPLEHFDWKTPRVGIGDEITVRLIDATIGDDPDEVYQPAPNPESIAPQEQDDAAASHHDPRP